ncbi:cell wall surface anchor family protein [Streptococcus pneumoniae]|nr:cell wall surface anchor family protein [Streptococcus pneumoniae]
MDTDVQLVDHQLVTITVVNQKLPRGNVDFMKVDGRTNTSLQGAMFKVMKEENGHYTPVLQNGKEVVVASWLKITSDHGLMCQIQGKKPCIS